MADLLCIPHAGGSASFYGTLIRQLQPSKVVAIELPGRGRRYGEPLLTDLETMVDWIIRENQEIFQAEFVLFGHSMGAVVAYELARRLSKPEQPKHLVVSACAAPHRRAGRGSVFTGASDDELIRGLEILDGLTPGVFSRRDIEEVFLPPLRADLGALARYSYDHFTGDLNLPVTVMGGRGDPEVTPTDLQDWQDLTSADIQTHTFEGGHFYLHQHERAVAEILRQLLQET